MKKIFIAAICFIVLSISVFLVSCSSSNSNNQNTSNSNTSSSNNSSSSLSNKTFTLEELKKYNGQNGNPAYVAVNGKVYDVTNARKWKNGKHEDGIVAGVDLSGSIGQSPHGTSVLKDVPIVGTLK